MWGGVGLLVIRGVMAMMTGIWGGRWQDVLQQGLLES